MENAVVNLLRRFGGAVVPLRLVAASPVKECENHRDHESPLKERAKYSFHFDTFSFRGRPGFRSFTFARSETKIAYPKPSFCAGRRPDCTS